MSVNNSSSTNSSLESADSLCSNSKADDFIISTLSATRIFPLIPISIFVLYLGFQQWRQQHSFKTASHSDIFTYNMAAMELIWSLGSVLHFFEVLSSETIVVPFLISIIVVKETGFHVLTCVDRYLAVVHPVKYRELRNSCGVPIRKVSIFCVWLLVLLLTCISYLYDRTLSTILLFVYLVASLAVVSFCSVSVLFVLFRPGPAAGAGDKKHIDQSKQRVFFTVMAIMGVLILIFMGFLISIALMTSKVLCSLVSKVMRNSLLWFSLPSSLVLPLLYLHKTRKLPCGHGG